MADVEMKPEEGVLQKVRTRNDVLMGRLLIYQRCRSVDEDSARVCSGVDIPRVIHDLPKHALLFLCRLLAVPNEH